MDWLSLTAALTTKEKGAFLGPGCWEAVGGRWYPQKDRHPQLPEAEGELGLRQALRLPTARAEVGLQRKGREAGGCSTLAEFCSPIGEGVHHLPLAWSSSHPKKQLRMLLDQCNKDLSFTESCTKLMSPKAGSRSSPAPGDMEAF